MKPFLKQTHQTIFVSTLITLLISFSGALAAGVDWTQKSPASKPSARTSHTMANIGGDQIVLFGGYDGSDDDETWVYDLSDDAWTQKNPASKPSARYFHTMANIGGDQVLLFGGRNSVL